MHLLIPFAAPLSEAGRAAAKTLALPHLAKALKTLAPAARDEGDEWSLTPPHERAVARAQGWQGGDGQWPFAAQAAAADGVDLRGLPWGLLTPAHWHLGTERISLIDPASLMLDETQSRALFDAVAPLFTSEGYLLAWGAPLRWYAAHDSFAALPTASLDRVIGRNIDRWLGSETAVRRIRRLQSEVQMQLHNHPLNAAREQRGLLPVNSFWISGCGAAQPTPASVNVDNSLRAGALAEDWAAWAKAWQVLDAGPLATLLHAPQAQLTLCGERSSAYFGPARQGFWQRVGSARDAWPTLMETL
jgi:hypothetical protein